jgi:hypothetical protein
MESRILFRVRGHGMRGVVAYDGRSELILRMTALTGPLGEMAQHPAEYRRRIESADQSALLRQARDFAAGLEFAVEDEERNRAA